MTYIEERVYVPDGMDVDHDERPLFQVGVYYRGNGLWVVAQGGHEGHRQLSRSGRWLWMPQKMNALQYCRFPFAEACERAEAAVNSVTINGLTWAGHQARFAAMRAGAS